MEGGSFGISAGALHPMALEDGEVPQQAGLDVATSAFALCPSVGTAVPINASSGGTGAASAPHSPSTLGTLH